MKKHLICFVILCQALGTFTEFVNLGMNVSINCVFQQKEIWWILLKPPNPPVRILRLFLNSPVPFYNTEFSDHFRWKYLVPHKPSLFIYNVTMDELGFYYCMSTGSSPEFSNVTKLQIKESPKPECQNHNVVNLERNQTAVNVPEQNHSSWAIIILISGALPGLLMFVIIGISCCYSGNNVKQTGLNQTLGLQETNKEYTQVMFYLTSNGEDEHC